MAEKTGGKAEYRSSIRSKFMIREALLAMLLEKPFEKVSVTDIVRKADINRGTFYAHFSNPTDVLNSISVSIVDEIASLFTGMDSTLIIFSPEECLEKINEVILKDIDFIRRLLSIEKFSKILDDARKATITRILQDLGDRCPEETKRQLVPALDFCISGIGSLYLDIIQGELDVELSEAPQFIADLLRPTSRMILDRISSRDDQ